MQNRGFTLIEMIVSLAIFSIVAVVALGALVKIISANHKAQALQAAFTNLNFALDSMSRELRVGSDYHCDNTTKDYGGSIGYSLTAQPCAVNNDVYTGLHPASIIVFTSSKSVSDGLGGTCNLLYSYRFVKDDPEGRLRLQKAEQPSCGSAIGHNNNDPDSLMDFFDILSFENMTLENYRLGVIGGDYPRVFIRLIGYAGEREKERTEFDVQTTISQRIPD